MEVIGALLALLVGLAVGFVINVVSTRLSANRPLFATLSCTRSAHPLKLAQAFPVVGYALQGGRCSTCGEKLSISYPLVELSMGLLFAALFLLEGWGLRFPFHALYVALLVLVLVIDWKHRDIYLSVIGLGALVALAGSALLSEVGIVSALIGAAVAGGFFLLAYLLAKLIFPRIEEPLGAGDVFLALMMGLMLGFPNVVGALLIGPLLAGAMALIMLLSRRSKLGDFMPYGVALCAATILFLIYPGPFAEALKLPSLSMMLFGHY
ncbi:MAG TPA: A24 family peptidase [Chloroflexia bacterium]|nr:A24 family peptidase [Chloroflexia bacterium]